MATIIAVVPDLFFAVKVTDGAKRAGREVRFARTADQALELAKSLRPAMVVADLNSVDPDPLEIARRIKADSETARIPVLGFVSHVQEERKQQALNAGFDKVVARSTFSDRAPELLSAGS